MLYLLIIGFITIWFIYVISHLIERNIYYPLYIAWFVIIIYIVAIVGILFMGLFYQELKVIEEGCPQYEKVEEQLYRKH